LPTVRIPTQLRSLTEGSAEVAASGATVAAVISNLESLFPGIGERLLDETGRPRRFINIYVDEEDVRFEDGMATAVRDDSTVSIIPSVAGGEHATRAPGAARAGR
jgi:molybdopterin synthase sulfur carrier subunit